MERPPDSLSVSTWPRRTTVENSSPSRTTHSAACAPPFIARAMTSVASCLSSVIVGVFRRGSPAALRFRRSAHGDRIHLDGRYPDADRHRLAVFAAGADAFVELEIVADHR